MNAFSFSLTKKFSEKPRKLDKSQQKTILGRMEKIIREPELGKPLRKELAGYRAERVEKLRIVYKVEEKQKHIIFTFVSHRKKAYN